MDIGIDLGTTYSVIAVQGRVETVPGYPDGEYIDDWDVTIIPTPEHEIAFPSVVGQDPGNPRAFIVGSEAKLRAEKGECPIMWSKRKIGTTEELHLGETVMTARDAAREVLKYLKACAERALGTTVTRAVVTHPAYFDLAQRRETHQAAIEAGFDMSLPEQMLMEPAAAALAYTRSEARDPLQLMVYDLGGRTFDVTVLERKNGVMSPLAFDGDHLLGGYNLDRKIAMWILKNVAENGHRVVHDRSNPEHRGRRTRLLTLAEEIKKRLAETGANKRRPVFVKLDFLVDSEGRGVQVNEQIAQEQFVELIEPELARTIECCERCLSKANLTTDDLDYVLLAGGSTHGPWIRDLVEGRFSTPSLQFRPDLCVAAGAAIHTESLAQFVQATGLKALVDVPSRSPLLAIDVPGRIECGDPAELTGLRAQLGASHADMQGPYPLTGDGSFLFEDVELLPSGDTAFELQVVDAAGGIRLAHRFSVKFDEQGAEVPDLSTVLPKPLCIKTASGMIALAEEGRELPSDEIREQQQQRRNDDNATHLPDFGGAYADVVPIATHPQASSFGGVDTSSGERVFIKMLADPLVDEPGESRRFLREPLLLQALADRVPEETIVPVLRVGQCDGRPYFVQPWIEGWSLAQAMAKRASFCGPSCFAVVAGCLRILAGIHAARVVHGDISPENILIGTDKPVAHHGCLPDDCEVWLVDFEDAAEVDSPERQVPHAVRGKVCYMAPELAKGLPLSAKSDLYALGIVFYEMLVGGRPYVVETVDDLARLDMASVPPIPTGLGVPRVVEELVRSLLLVDPGARTDTAAECLEQLRGLSDVEEWLNRRTIAVRAPGRTRQRVNVITTIGHLLLDGGAEDGDFRPLEQAYWSFPIKPREEPGTQAKDELRDDFRPEVKSLRARTEIDSLPLRTDVASPSYLAHGFVGEVHGAATRIDENVQFTLYRPETVRPEVWYSMLAFAHLSHRPLDAEADEPDPVQEVRRQATQVLGELADKYQDLTTDSSQGVPRQGELTFLPEAEGVRFNPPRRSFLWNETVHREEFRLMASSRADGLTVRGRLTVLLGNIILAEIALAIRVDSRALIEPEASPTEVESVKPFRRIFASYSHKDLAIVRQFEHFASLFGDEYVRDWTHLRAGEDWSPRLMEMIENADIFQLFWSWNSMESDFVRSEYEHALSLGRPHFVRPFHWEDPLPRLEEGGLPPEELLRLHFQRIPLCETPHGEADLAEATASVHVRAEPRAARPDVVPADPREVLDRLLHTIGQHHVIGELEDVAQRLSFGFMSDVRPRAVLLFVGKWGDGQRYAAEALAECAFGSPSRMVPFDMDDFCSADAKSKLLGALPGRPGYGEGLFTNVLRDCPQSVIVFEGIERAHPTVIDMLLGAVQGGEVRDLAQRVYSLTECVLVLTANVSPPEELREFGCCMDTEACFTALCRAGILPYPESPLSRWAATWVDRIVPFGPLTHQDFTIIVAARLADAVDRLKAQKGKEICYDGTLVQSLADLCVARGGEGVQGAHRVIDLHVIEPSIKWFAGQDAECCSAVQVFIQGGHPIVESLGLGSR